MTVEEMRQKKKEKGYSYAQISDWTGVPLGTVQKVFSGETMNPRYDTLRALEELFLEESVVREGISYYAEGSSAEETKETDGVRKIEGPGAYTRQGEYTIADYYALPDEQRVELIDGYIYDMAAPTPLHQLIAGEIHRQIANFIMERNGDCQPFVSPIDVQLDCDEKTMIQPDVVILCDPDKLKKWGIYGAPDFVLEVISPSTKRKDYTKKPAKYMDAGVKEYWIVDPYQKMLIVYCVKSEEYAAICSLDQPVPIRIYDGKLEIRFEHIVKWMEDLIE